MNKEQVLSDAFLKQFKTGGVNKFFSPVTETGYREDVGGGARHSSWLREA